MSALVPKQQIRASKQRWSGQRVLQHLGIEKQQGFGSLSTFCSLPESKDEGVVLIFDEVTALTGHAGALNTFVQELRSLQHIPRY